MDLLYRIVRDAGVVLAFAGVLAAAPEGYKRIWRTVRRWLGRRHDAVAQSLADAGSALDALAVTKADGVVSGRTVEQRVEQLEHEVPQLREQVDTLRANHEELLGTVAAGDAEAQRQVADVQQRIKRAEEQAAWVDAAALPVAAMGVLMTSLRDVYVHKLWVDALLLFGAALAVAFYGYGWRTRRRTD
jgi:hypothetical protein